MKKYWRRRFTLSSDTKSLLTALLLLTGCFALVITVPYYLATGDDRISAVIVVSEDVGRLQSARFIDRFLRRETEIETEKGVFLVHGAFVARKGHSLVLEQRDDGARMLCDPTEKICARLVY